MTAGCVAFKPGSVENAAFLQRTLQREDSEFRVEVAVPSREEAARLFDRKLHWKGIQPVWLRVENRRDSSAFFLPHIVDDEYFSPLEVAYQYHSAYRPKLNAALDGFFLTNAMSREVPPHSIRSGFVYTHLDLGNKQVCVGLADEAGVWRDHRYNFFVEVPGLKGDWKPHSWEDLTRGAQFTECDEAQLRAELERMPRATTDAHGRKEGDPLNLVLIGSPEDLQSMAACGWNRTERLTTGTAWHTFRALVSGEEYRYSPVGSLYWSGRHQDIAFQKIRHSIKLRNHLRLWLTSLKYHGKPVWIGQISRDIGVRWTLKTSNLTTHTINPNVDEARAYLIQDLVLGRAARWWGFVKGAEAAPMESPRRNLTGDPYFTDGLRAVIELSAEPVKSGEAEFQKWETPPDNTHGY